MVHRKQRKLALLAAFALAAALSGTARAAEPAVDAALQDTAAYLQKTVPGPQVGSIGGEWAVLGLARSGAGVPEAYFQRYYAGVEAYVKGRGGVLHDKKYTEYSRVVVALSALGKDARNVAGYDLTLPLGDYDKTVWQGINGPIWALIALDSAGYPMPENPDAATQATRQMYVDCILSRQLDDGGWSLSGGTSADSRGRPSDPDVTGMALQALAKYQDQPAAAAAAEEALACLSAMQDGEGGFSSWGEANSESCVQVVVALTELGIPLDDPRFVKNGHTLLENLLSFYEEGNGFRHTRAGSGNSLMSTEQGLYALAAVRRAGAGENSLYRMGDALSISGRTEEAPAQGLPGKDGMVKSVPVTVPNAAFPDLAGNPAAPAVQALAARGIVNGKSGGSFDPEGNMTRAEFAAVVVRALGLEPEAADAFSDVPAGAWYAGYVGTASGFGIVTGGGDGSFSPQGTITRQEAAGMAARAARLCGVDTEMDDGAVRNILAQFPDYVNAAGWARPSLALCYQEDILSQDDLDIRPLDAVTRAEVARMLYRLLDRAALL